MERDRNGGRGDAAKAAAWAGTASASDSQARGRPVGPTRREQTGGVQGKAPSSDLRLGDFNTLTLDVVGTLIDLEAGILRWFRTVLGPQGVARSDEHILSPFAASEHRLHRTAPGLPFTDMLPLIYRDMAAEWGMQVTEQEAEGFKRSIRTWPAFPDTVAALKELGNVYRLVAVTNVDTWALEHMSATLGDPFDEQVTCDEVGVNKPDPRVFEYVLEKLAPGGVRKSDILHAAQSQYHDIAPAQMLGIATLWIERRHGKAGSGATPDRSQRVTPDFHATSLSDFARQLREEQA